MISGGDYWNEYIINERITRGKDRSYVQSTFIPVSEKVMTEPRTVYYQLLRTFYK